MKRLFIIATIALLNCSAITNLIACWAAPPDYQFLAAEDDDYFFRQDNINKIIEVRSSKTLDLVWKTKIEDLSSIFSRVLVADEGKKIIRIKGNHEVNSLNDTAVEYYHQDGKVERFPASHFVTTLHKVEQTMSTSPAHMWHSGFRYSKDSGLIVFPRKPVVESGFVAESKRTLSSSGMAGNVIILAVGSLALAVLVTFLVTYRLTRRRN